MPAQPREGFMRITVDERPAETWAVWPPIERLRAEMVGKDFEVALSPTVQGPCRVLDVEWLSPRVIRIGLEVAADLVEQA